MVVKIENSLTGRLEGSPTSDIFAATTGGIGNATISTGGGNDVVIGNNLFPNGNGIGIFGTSIGAEDSLTVTASGVTIGMVGVTINGGNSQNNITARGNFLGVAGVSINGGDGGDSFDLQNGTGRVDGGSGIDSLSLDGGISEYTFTETSSPFNKSVNILGAINGTNLDVTDVEQFVLGGVQFSFDELFEGNGTPVEVSIADLSPQEEGNTGTTDFTFTVSRTGDDSEAVTVDWAVSPGSD